MRTGKPFQIMGRLFEAAAHIQGTVTAYRGKIVLWIKLTYKEVQTSLISVMLKK